MLSSDEVYRKLHGELEVLDKRRKYYYNKVKPSQFLMWFVLWIIGPFLLIRYNVNSLSNFYFSDESWELVGGGYFGLVVVVLLIFAITHNFQMGKFKKEFTGMVVPKVLGGLGDLDYEYEGDIGRKSLEDSLLFKPFRDYHSQDYVIGRIGSVHVQFAEVTQSIQVRSGGKSEKRDTFKGLFFEAEMEGNYPVPIWIVSQKHKGSLMESDKVEIPLSHPQLKKCRAFTSDMDLAARHLPAYEKSVAEVNTLLDKKLKLTFGYPGYHFEGPSLQVAIPLHRMPWEPRLGRSLLDSSFIDEQVVLLNALLSLTKKFEEVQGMSGNTNGHSS